MHGFEHLIKPSILTMAKTLSNVEAIEMSLMLM